MASFQDRWDWLMALGSILLVWSLWCIGANDVANSYATAVSSRTLTLPQAGILASITEFVGAIALGARVTGTIRSGIISPSTYQESPAVLILGMVTAEFGSAVWLTVATRLGFPVSTTQSIVGALVGVGLASRSAVTWGWKSGSVSQVAASWFIAPAIAAGFGIIIMGSMRVLILDRKDPLRKALFFIPLYYGLTAGIFTLFIVISGGHGIPTIEEIGAGKIVGIVLGVFFGIIILTAVFFVPYFYRHLIKNDGRVQFWHVPLGPLLLKDKPPPYWPGKHEQTVLVDYYSTSYTEGSHNHDEKQPISEETSRDIEETPTVDRDEGTDKSGLRQRKPVATMDKEDSSHSPSRLSRYESKLAGVPKWSPKWFWLNARYFALRGVMQDVIGHQSAELQSVHDRAPQFDNKVEYLWTTAQVLSSMIMSISHGANDVSNAIGPFTTEYITWTSGQVNSSQPTPIWIPAVGGVGLALGFWTYGYHIMRSLGNKITKLSPTRGYAAELSAAITVLLASRLGLPVSTTQCVTGGIIGVALVNFDLKSINWKQLGWIFLGWVLTVPAAGLIAGILMLLFLNTPHF